MREAADLIERWHGRDDGRLQYAVTPRFAVSCTADLLRESAALARSTGAYWQTHLSEDRGEIAEVARLFPESIDYVDVYDRAGGLGERTVLAHAVHLSDRELARLVETGTRVAHCPASNLFLASGVMPLARYLEAGLIGRPGLGRGRRAGPLDLHRDARRCVRQERAAVAGLGTGHVMTPLDWLRMGTLGGASVLGLADRIGSLEAGKEADVIAVDPSFVAPIAGVTDDDPDDLVSRLVYRTHPDMVRGGLGPRPPPRGPRRPRLGERCAADRRAREDRAATPTARRGADDPRLRASALHLMTLPMDEPSPPTARRELRCRALRPVTRLAAGWARSALHVPVGSCGATAACDGFRAGIPTGAPSEDRRDGRRPRVRTGPDVAGSETTRGSRSRPRQRPPDWRVCSTRPAGRGPIERRAASERGVGSAPGSP